LIPNLVNSSVGRHFFFSGDGWRAHTRLARAVCGEDAPWRRSARAQRVTNNSSVTTLVLAVKQHTHPSQRELEWRKTLSTSLHNPLWGKGGGVLLPKVCRDESASLPGFGVQSGLRARRNYDKLGGLVAHLGPGRRDDDVARAGGLGERGAARRLDAFATGGEVGLLASNAASDSGRCRTARHGCCYDAVTKRSLRKCSTPGGVRVVDADRGGRVDCRALTLWRARRRRRRDGMAAGVWISVAEEGTPRRLSPKVLRDQRLREPYEHLP
jgi:hypothetical protein